MDGLPSPSIMVDVQLPAGMTLNDVFNQVSVAIVVSCAAAALFWDHLQLFPHEMKAYYSVEAPHWRVWDLTAFILLRYAGIAAMIGFIFLHVVGTSHCETTWMIVQAAGVITSATSCFLVALRVTHMLWCNDVRIAAGLAILSFAIIGSQIAANNFSRVSGVKGLSLTSGCIFHPFPSWVAIEHISRVVLNAVCVALTLAKLMSKKRKRGVELRHFQDCLLCLMLSAFGNGVIFVIRLLPEDYHDAKVVIAPLSILISVASGTRIAVGTRVLRHFLSQRLPPVIVSPASFKETPSRAIPLTSLPLPTSHLHPHPPPSRKSSASSGTHLLPQFERSDNIPLESLRNAVHSLRNPDYGMPAIPANHVAPSTGTGLPSYGVRSPTDSPIEFAPISVVTRGDPHSPKHQTLLAKSSYTSFPPPPPWSQPPSLTERETGRKFSSPSFRLFKDRQRERHLSEWTE